MRAATVKRNTPRCSTVVSVHGDDALLASMVGTIAGVWMDYRAGYADGDQYNSVTASPRYPLGLHWIPEDVEPDGVHPTAAGKFKMGQSMIDRFRADPVKAWMWTDGNQPPPEPPTVVTSDPLEAFIRYTSPSSCHVLVADADLVQVIPFSVCTDLELVP